MTTTTSCNFKRVRWRRFCLRKTLLLSSTALLFTSYVILFFTFAPPSTVTSVAAITTATTDNVDEPSLSASPPIDINNGQSNLREGQRLFQLGQYNAASAYLWRAVLLHSSQQTQQQQSLQQYYEVDEAFTPFLQCYIYLNRIVDGLIFISCESYLRGQNSMGEMYLMKALEESDDDDGKSDLYVRELYDIVFGKEREQQIDDDDDYDVKQQQQLQQKQSLSVIELAKISKIRDHVDASLVNDDNNKKMKSTRSKMEEEMGNTISNDSSQYQPQESDQQQQQQQESSSISTEISTKYENYTPEQIYNIGTQYFNTKNLVIAEQLFELSCRKSYSSSSSSSSVEGLSDGSSSSSSGSSSSSSSSTTGVIGVACTNAIYIRSNLCDWGTNGSKFNNDMQMIKKITLAEMELYRSVVKRLVDDDDDDEIIRRKAGISPFKRFNKQQNEYIYWNRGTSVHPHMMLGYPLQEIGNNGNGDENENVRMLKRYAAESMASLDELRARVNEDASGIRELPTGLPYSVKEMHDKFVKKYQQQHLHQDWDDKKKEKEKKEISSHPPPIKVGFVACGFNSKAVLYLSHDIFRFFDPDIVEIHIFSTGRPDHPNFIQHTMRGVDWRQRVIDNVDYFHNVHEYQNDHIGLAQYIHNLEIQILIEWDGYARQGERAAGLMALRPAPIQILHQEFLMTSGAQYIDYIVTDKIVSPVELEGLYTEKFLWLPNHFFSKGHAMQKEVLPPQFEYIPRQKEDGAEFQLGIGSPQENACLSSNPLGTDTGDDEEVSFVYCNFNKFLKHNPETVRSWVRILEEVPNSILCLLENPREGIPNLRKFVTEVSTSSSNHNSSDKSDVNARIHFLPWEKNPFDHQRRSFSLCNAMLDSHPYNGHTTAQDALYAGVPIVTRSDGDDMSSRVSTSANIVLGLEDMNAYNGVEEYENIAIRLGKDKDWFTSIRTKLIETCLQKNPMHPYWDVPRYVMNFQNGLTTIWSNFLSGDDIEHVEVKEEDGYHGTTEADVLSKEEKRKQAMKKLRDNNVKRDHQQHHGEL